MLIRSSGRKITSVVARSRKINFHQSRFSSKVASTPTSLVAQYALPLSALSLMIGFAAGRSSFRTPEEEARIEQLPKGYPLACCGDQECTSCELPELSPEHQKLVKTLRRIVGLKNYLDGREQTTQTAPFLKGARLGQGTALAIVRPTKLKQIQEIVQASVDAGAVVLVQGSNTGLTGGSTPRDQTDGRPTVLISMKNFDTVFPIDGGEKVVCLAGVGLASLKNFVSENFDRESHSILGSTFLNPTTAAGKSTDYTSSLACDK